MGRQEARRRQANEARLGERVGRSGQAQGTGSELVLCVRRVGFKIWCRKGEFAEESAVEVTGIGRKRERGFGCVCIRIADFHFALLWFVGFFSLLDQYHRIPTSSPCTMPSFSHPRSFTLSLSAWRATSTSLPSLARAVHSLVGSSLPSSIKSSRAWSTSTPLATFIGI